LFEILRVGFPIVFGLTLILRADAIVAGIARRYALTELNKTDIRFRNARLFFKLVGVAAMIAGTSMLLSLVMR